MLLREIFGKNAHSKFFLEIEKFNFLDAERNTPLFYAAEGGFFNSVVLLLVSDKLSFQEKHVLIQQ